MPETDPSDAPRPRSSGALTVTPEPDEDLYLLRAEGELDVSNVDLFEDCLRAAEASDASHILVDLSALSFMDSAGLRALLMASRRVRSGSQRLSVRASGGVRRIIELTGMASYLSLGEGA